MTPSRILVLQDPEWLPVLVKSAHMHTVRLMNSRLKNSKKNDDKSAVAMLKKGDWHESVRELVINYVQGHDRSGRPDEKRDDELKRGPTGRRSSDARQLSCVFQDMKPPKSILRKSSDIRKPIRCVKFTKAIARHAKNSRTKSFARNDLPKGTSSAQPQRSKI